MSLNAFLKCSSSVFKSFSLLLSTDQVWIPVALCAIHNFIGVHDSADKIVYAADGDGGDDGNAPLNDHPVPAAPAADGPSARCDRIAQEMWEDYLEICRERGIGEGNQSEGDDNDDNNGDGDDDGDE
jgi:hypothetical protein